jgi:hypothetical protein
VEALRKDKNEIFRAAQDASRATEFLIAFERERSVAEQRSGTIPAVGTDGSQKNRGEEKASKAVEQSKTLAEQSVGGGTRAGRF